MENKFNLSKYSPEEIGDILSKETIHLTSMYLKENKKDTVDKVYWLGIHLGFIAGLKLCGMPDEDGEKIIDISQDKLSEHYYGKK